MSKQRVIDFRVRPPYKNYLKFFANPQETNDLLGYDFPVSPSEREKSMELLIQELDEAGVEKAVVPGRGLFGVDNAELFELAELYPGRFIIFPYVNPLEGDKALDEVDKYVINGRGKGIAIEPGFQAETYQFNDERAFPLYKKLEENDIPLLVTYSGAAIPNIDPNSIYYLDRVAEKFPGLKIILAHAGWPFSREAVAVAFKRRNVYLIPDAYGLSNAGGDDYIKGANTFIPNQLVYGSSYPVLPIVESVEAYRKAGLKESAADKFFYQNAANILKLKD